MPDPAWEKGDDWPAENADKMFTAGIRIGNHGNAVCCYGETAEVAAERRDLILRAIAALPAS